MNTKASAGDLFDPRFLKARFIAQQVQALDEEAIFKAGGKKVGSWEITMNAEAVLKTLKRIVRDDRLGKAFADGEVFAQIPDERTALVSFYRMPDDSGVAIAKTSAGGSAMRVLLSKVDLSDLDFQKGMTIQKPKTVTNKEDQVEIEVGGKTILVKPVSKTPSEYRHIQMEMMMAQAPIPMGNPLIIKEFLTTVYSGDSQAIPMGDVANLPIAAIMASTSEAHPDDNEWPEGITVTNGDSKSAYTSPKQAIAEYQAALKGIPAKEVLSDDQVMESFRKQRMGGPK